MKNDTAIKVVMTEELKEKAQAYAKEMNISLNALVRLSLTDYLKNNN